MEKHYRDVTIKDVAQHAGVAVSTVSRVLNDLDRVSDTTREKVKKACEELGYVRNTLAASVKTGRSNMIVALVPDIINEYYTAVIQGVEEIAAKAGYYTLVFTSNDDPQKEIELFNGNFGKIVDGVVMIPAHDELRFIEAYDKPVIIVDRYISGSNAQAVIIDNLKGSYELAKELIDNGHKDIAILIGPKKFNIGKDRMKGFEMAMEEAGVDINPDYVKKCTWYVDSGYEKTNELLDMENPPTAIYATNNLLCVGCIEAIAERGLKIGEDISLVGFDDTLLAQYMAPGVTVGTRETIEMGRMAAQKLINILENGIDNDIERKVVLPVTLVRRNSVKKLN